MTFTECSIAALKAYWRTAVVIDDDAQPQRTEQVKQLSTPRRSGQASQETERSKEFQGASLNVPALVDAFLQQSILCTVFDRKEVLVEGLETLLRSDILVLDWKLDDDGSSTARFISECASRHPNTLHMICIYTSEPDLEIITKKLKEQSQELEEINTNDINSSDSTTEASSESEETKSSGIYSIGSTYVLVVNKGRSQTALNSRSAEERELPRLLFQEFAPLVGGLLRNAVFHSIGAIRNNTHTLLNRFHPDMDSAFVAHRVYSNPCEDTEEHIIPLICSEFGNILRQESISKQLDKDNILTWINDANRINIIKKNINEESIADDCLLKQIDKLLTVGIERINIEKEEGNLNNVAAHLKKIEKGMRLRHSELTQLWGSKTPSLADIKLSILMSCVYFYTNIIPIMQSGTIIKETHDSKINYYCCIQPPCDCLRIEEDGRPFLFIPLKTVGKESAFDIPLLEKDDIIYLSKIKKSYNIEAITFIPSKANDNIYARKVGKDFIFESMDKRVFTFCAQLNDIHALRLIQTYSSDLARIGLMESDWQRRCSK